MAPGKHALDPSGGPRRLTSVPHAVEPDGPDRSDESEAVAVLRAASDETGPLEIITPDMLAKVRHGLAGD